jgi:spermidine/putrescine transport system permease protein
MSAVSTPERETIATHGPEHKPRRRATRFVLPSYSLLVIFLLTSPVFVMIVYSFNHVPGDRQTAKFFGWTLDWWANAFKVPGLTPAFWTSIKIALASAPIATILGTPIGLALGRYRFFGRGPVNFVIFLAIAVPEIVLGSALLTLFLEQGIVSLGPVTILLSHVAFSVPFVAVTVRARVQGLDRSLEDAAQDLFASPLVAFFKVTLPLILPGVISGLLLAFVLSLDDFVITNFVSGSTATLPIWVFGASRIGFPPQVNVLATILFMTGVFIAVANVVFRRKEQI